MKNFFRKTCLAVATGALLLAGAGAANAATITIVNADGANEGFNDPTPVLPVGGNTGTTLGQQRLIAFQFAADVWGALLPSAVEIRVTASFDPLTCTTTTAVLGSAGPRTYSADFANAPLAATWYPAALANKLSGVDLNPGAMNSTADDLRAQFNVSLGGATCLPGSGWYLGLDGNAGSSINLVVVLMHEFGHGLGFISLVNNSTGALFSSKRDVYSNFLYDNTVGMLWPDMTSTQRVASAINPGNVAFTGQWATWNADNWLGYASELLVSAPAGVAGSYNVGDAGFGPTVASTPVTGQVVLAIDDTAPTSDACSALQNAAALSGKIAMVDRGTCAFAVKVQAAQDAGAIGVIVVNNVAGAPSSMGGSGPAVTIPSVMISQADGVTLKAALASGLTATIHSSATKRAGADPLGRPLVYTPNPLQSGSSVSHFDTSAMPNLLMEPSINADLDPDGVDLALSVFHDLGWFADAPAPAPTPALRTLLAQNTPNPFNPSTTIRFTLADGGDTELQVFDVRGNNIKRLVAGSLAAGDHSVTWDGSDEAGQRVPSGIYFYRLRSGAYEGLQRMVLLK